MTTYAKALARLTADLTGDISKLTVAQQRERRRQRLLGTTVSPLETPWGPAQHIASIAPGIISISTASHGGMLVDRDKLALMPATLRAIDPFAGKYDGGAWYEEDCDWAIVVLAFPTLFSPHQVYEAALMPRRKYVSWSKAGCDFLASDAGQQARGIADAWFKENREKFVRGGAGTMGHGWLVDFYRVDGKGHMRVLMKDYPKHAPLTDAEVKALGEWTIVE